MKKNLLIFLSCIGICVCAYRFGDIGWSEAKSTAMEGMHAGITKFMLPMVTLYDVPEGYPVCQDIGLFVMPVLGTIGQDELLAYENAESENENSKQQDFETEEIIETSTSMETDSQLPIESETESGEKEEPVAETVAFAGLEKKVVINRQKLQDFDYLLQNFYQIDNSTTIGSEQLNVDKLLAKDLTLKENVEGPQILIYHTHSQEGYKGAATEGASTSVVAIGDYLTQLLSEQYGLQVLHHKGEYDVNDRDSSYSNALPAIQKILEENPTIEVVIDLHRDGVPETTHLVTEINGKQTAQIMFFNGLSRTTSQGDLTYLPNPYIEDNLAFSFQMQLAAEEYFPGLTRRIYLKGYRYNMHVCPKTLLVEVGAQTNTFEEAKNAMEPLATLLGNVLKY